MRFAGAAAGPPTVLRVRPNRSASSLIDLPARYGAATALVVENRARLGSASRLAAGLALMPMWPWPPIDEWSRHTGPGEDELIRDEFAVRMRTSMHKLDGREVSDLLCKQWSTYLRGHCCNDDNDGERGACRAARKAAGVG